MANTYTQIHIQSVFAVQNRDAVISPKWQDDLYKYITGIVQSREHKLLAIGGMPDHVHLLFGFRPIQSLSGLMHDIKGGSSRWINEKIGSLSQYKWQQHGTAICYAHCARAET